MRLHRALRWMLICAVVSFDVCICAARASATVDTSASVTSYVNPFIGTDAIGRTFPGADVPFGMVQWSPDTSSWSPGGYTYTDSTIKGFSLTHLSGTGCSVYQDIPFMPFVGQLSVSPATHPSAYASTFSHAAEQATPGFYGVQLGSGVQVRLTVTPRTGFGTFAYPATTAAQMLINAGGSVNGDNVASVQIMTDTNEVVGSASSNGFCGRATPYTVYFAAQFSRPFASSGFGTWNGGTVTPGSITSQGSRSGAYVTFDTTQEPAVFVKVGLSFVSVQNALANIQAEDPNPLTGAGFDAVRTAADSTWSTMLSHITVSGGTDMDKQTFYTALYHSLLQPNVFSDANGQYIGFDNQIHTATYTDNVGQTVPYTQYANYSGWDIYRTEIPLLALLAPQETDDMMQSLVEDAQQSGWLPRWALANNDADVMVGDPADPMLAGAYAFGATHFDTTTALQTMIKGATQSGASSTGYVERPDLGDYLTYGYVPQDHDLWYPASKTLEYATADFATAQFARAFGDVTTYTTLMQRAQNWQNLYNPASGYIEPRQSDGTFPSPYDPVQGDGFIEGNSTQYTWMIPFNLHALFNAMGGNQQVASRLDAFFGQLNAGLNSPYAWLGNEPSLETPWEYDFAGEPWRTQEVVRQALLQLFNPSFTGLPGNDDLGTTSAWYVWAALGLYPETPGVGNLVIGSPLFPLTTLHLAGGDVTIAAPAAADTTPYVQSMMVNGQPYAKPWLPYAILANGATLQYTLGDMPNTAWSVAASDAPPSFDTGEAPALGYITPSSIVTMTAASSASFQFAVRNVTDAPLSGQWSATAPEGLQLSQSAGAFSVSGAAEQVQSLAVSIAPGTARGRYIIPFHAQATSSIPGRMAALPPVDLQVVVEAANTPTATPGQQADTPTTLAPTATPIPPVDTATSTPPVPINTALQPTPAAPTPTPSSTRSVSPAMPTRTATVVPAHVSPSATPAAPLRKHKHAAMTSRKHARLLRLRLTVRVLYATIRPGGSEILLVQTAPGARVSAAIIVAHHDKRPRVHMMLHNDRHGHWRVLIVVSIHSGVGTEHVAVTAKLGPRHTRVSRAFRVVNKKPAHRIAPTGRSKVQRRTRHH